MSFLSLNNFRSVGQPSNAGYGQAERFQGEQSELMKAPGQFALANANMFNSAGGGLAGGFGAYAQSAGQLGTALANLYGNSMAARGQAEMARQAGLANVGSAGLSAYGQMMGGALGAQGANASAYYKALSDMGLANQQAMGQYGASRDAALANTAAAAANAGSQFGNAYSGLAGNLAAARSNAAGSLGQSYGAAMTGLGNSASQLGQATSQATGNLYGTIGSAAGNVASNIGNAYGNLFGNAATATSNYGMNSQQARANLLESLANAGLGAYSTGADYTRDMAKLGLARELGLGQLTVGSQAAAAMPSLAAGIGGAAGGQATGSSTGSSTNEPIPPAGDGTDFRSSEPRFYDDPQMLPAFDPGREYSIESLDGLDRQVLSNIAARAAEGGGGIGEIGAAALSGLTDMADAGASNISSGAAPAYQQIDRMRGDTRDMYTGLSDEAFGGIDRDAIAGFGGIDQAAGRTFSSIDSSRDAIQNSGVLQQLIDQDRDARSQLERGNLGTVASIMEMASRGGAGINDIVGSSFGNINLGMSRFNDGLDRSLYSGAADARGALGGLASQYGDFATGLSGLFGDAMSENSSLFADTIGNRDEFKSPADREREAMEAEAAFFDRARERDRLAALAAYESERRSRMGDSAYYGLAPLPRTPIDTTERVGDLNIRKPVGEVRVYGQPINRGPSGIRSGR